MPSPRSFSDKNLYAYCDNNPVMRADASGEIWHVALGAVIGLVVSVTVNVAANLMEGKRGLAAFDGWQEAAVGGAVYGGILAGTGNIVAASYGGAAAESAVREVKSYIGGKQATANNMAKSFERVMADTAVGGTIGLAGGKAASKIMPKSIKVNKSWKYKKFTSAFSPKSKHTKLRKRMWKSSWFSGMFSFGQRYGYKYYSKSYKYRYYWYGGRRYSYRLF
jgi:uncharacterized membrane protein (Fun14 family)